MTAIQKIMSKTVCIIGAGPSGLVAAKTLIHNFPKGAFSVTIYEQSERIGGLWPLSLDDKGMVNPEMRTNISRHTVSFSDLAWPESAPTFPKAWQVGQYLESYVEKYPGYDICTSAKVLSISRSRDDENPMKWRVEIDRAQISPEVSEYDHVIVASGFFGKSAILPKLVQSTSTPIKHSTEFRTLDLLLKDKSGQPLKNGGKILVIGGSMSGAEVAASIGIQLSSAIHSTAASNIIDAEKYRVCHVQSQPTWVIPLFLATNGTVDNLDGTKSFNPAPSFLPLDPAFNDLSRRPPGDIFNISGYINPESAKMSHAYFQSLLGTDQSELHYSSEDRPIGSPLAFKGEDLTKPPWLSISDSYAEFVRSGIIEPVIGRIEDQSYGSDGTIVISTKEGERTVTDVAAVILATGFEATNTMNLFSKDVLAQLGFDATCAPMPLNLNINGTVHKDVPDLGFVGFYRGPYWGVMEMQARYLGKLWSGDAKASKLLAEEVSPISSLREEYHKDKKQVAQFPMGDYTYLTESFKAILDVDRIGEGRVGPVIPARYMMPNASEDALLESAKELSHLGALYRESTTGTKFVSKAIFRAMQGDWKVDRKLVSSIATYPSGHFKGIAKFHPRTPENNYDLEYLYVEDGDFKTVTGLEFRATRRYGHRYQESTDTLSVWFVKADGKSVDYLFHKLEVLQPKNGSGWLGQAEHLCIDDMYNVSYEFRFKAVGLEEWTMKYSVKGPKKDYTIETKYRR